MAEPPPAEASVPSKSAKNRRRHMRIDVNFAGCVRLDGFEDDIVVCENISAVGCASEQQALSRIGGHRSCRPLLPRIG